MEDAAAKICIAGPRLRELNVSSLQDSQDQKQSLISKLHTQSST